MAAPEGLDWEVVVVNNGCTDHTEEVIAAFVGRLPLRRDAEPVRGLPRARNRAVDAARGDYVLWTDDDVVVDPGRLAAYLAAFRRHPGRRFLAARCCRVMRRRCRNGFWKTRANCGGFRPLGYRQRGNAAVGRQRVYYMPCGPNVAIRASEQRRFRYNLNLGMAPGQKRRGEELDVLERVRRTGAAGTGFPTRAPNIVPAPICRRSVTFLTILSHPARPMPFSGTETVCHWRSRDRPHF
jgi:glucosyl-dolichyl phosphate glucuronosyltransferase